MVLEEVERESKEPRFELETPALAVISISLLERLESLYA
jgi:hypothetical protein